MANTDRAAGFKVVGTHSGASINHSLRRAFIPATDGTAVAIGDLVKTAGSADADGVPTVAKCGVGDYVRGVVVGIEPDPDNLSAIYRVASTARYVLINEDPLVELEVQEDSVGGALAATNIGQNADLIDAGVDTTRGTSGMELDSSTAATTNTLALRIVGIVQRPDNEIGANAKVRVMINLHEFRTQTTGT